MCTAQASEWSLGGRQDDGSPPALREESRMPRTASARKGGVRACVRERARELGFCIISNTRGTMIGSLPSMSALF